MKRVLVLTCLILCLNFHLVLAQESKTILVLPAANGAYAGIDNLGRGLVMPGDEAVPNEPYPREDRYVGLFYFLWLAQHGKTGPYDVSKIVAEHPEAIHDPDHPAWGPMQLFHHWGESLFGYYTSEDAWVMRKHVQMLTDAGVDFLVFDATNAAHYQKPVLLLCEILDEYQKKGWNVPKLVHYTNSSSGKTMQNIYEAFYKTKLYPDLWFYWEGKPLIIGHPEEASDEVKDFFRIKKSQWPNEGKFHDDGFPWIAFERPQHVFKNAQGENEVMTVSVAQHSGTVRFSSSAFYGDQTNRTRSWHNGKNDPDPNAVLYGYNFTEEFDFAIEQDPKIVFLTGWNEWIAMRFNFGIPKEPVGFVDLCDMNNSRDLEPMLGGYGDNYYMLMIDRIRKYKGVPPLQKIGPDAKKTININGTFAQWDSVKTLYRDYTNDVGHRDITGYGELHYTNTTGRNDFDLMKVAFDANSISFYVKTVDAIKYSTAENAMTLYLSFPELARKDVPHWENYHFAVNRAASEATDQVIIERSTGGWNWDKVAITYGKVEGNQMHFALSRKILGLGDSPVNVQFKWADNCPIDGNIDSFYIDGDTAPVGRLNYVFVE